MDGQATLLPSPEPDEELDDESDEEPDDESPPLEPLLSLFAFDADEEGDEAEGDEDDFRLSFL